jgi:hypothetical protein
MSNLALMAASVQLTSRRVSLFGLCRDIPRISADKFCDPATASDCPPAALGDRFGSNSEVGGRNREVRCAPVNGHRQADLACPKSAMNGSGATYPITFPADATQG